MGECGSPGQGKDPVGNWRTVRPVTIASAAAPSRLLAPALAAASVLMFVLVGRADGAERAWNSPLAPAGACSAADDASAPVASQARAVACLVNWARRQENRARLLRRSALQRAAELKGQSVASCGQFSHTPCGAPVTSGVNASGYRYATFGENLFAGTWGKATPREVVNAWLNSPPHRANIMSGRFRHVGAAPVRASGLLGGGDTVIWTATFASPR
jgi:uncharacterized protein YkwD